MDISLTYLPDIHVHPPTQRAIASTLDKLYTEGKIQAVLIENRYASLEPITPVTIHDFCFYFNLLSSPIPLYGMDDPKLHEKGSALVRDLIKLSDEIESRRVTDEDLERLVYINNTQDEISDKRSRFFVDHAIAVCKSQNYSTIAMVAGQCHELMIKKCSLNKGITYHLMDTVVEPSEEFLAQSDERFRKAFLDPKTS